MNYVYYTSFLHIFQGFFHICFTLEKRLVENSNLLIRKNIKKYSTTYPKTVEKSYNRGQ